jgi:hypothetical protein
MFLFYFIKANWQALTIEVKPVLLKFQRLKRIQVFSDQARLFETVFFSFERNCLRLSNGLCSCKCKTVKETHMQDLMDGCSVLK